MKTLDGFVIYNDDFSSLQQMYVTYIIDGTMHYAHNHSID